MCDSNRTDPRITRRDTRISASHSVNTEHRLVGDDAENGEIRRNHGYMLLGVVIVFERGRIVQFVLFCSVLRERDRLYKVGRALITET